MMQQHNLLTGVNAICCRKLCSALFRVVPVAGTGKTVGTPTFWGFFMCLFRCSTYIPPLPKPEVALYNVNHVRFVTRSGSRQVLILLEQPEQPTNNRVSA
jgi:hypothetical protein